MNYSQIIKRSWKKWSILFVVLLIICGGVLLSKMNQQRNKTKVAVPVLIYTQEIESAENEYLRPTVNIMRKMGDAKPEKLAEIEGSGYPEVGLSPDKKDLLINLGSKLQVLNLKTKELSDLFIPKLRVVSASYSSDGKQLFIWDQDLTDFLEVDKYFVHRFTLSNRKDEVINQGSTNLFAGRVWRDDGKVVLMRPLGSAAHLYFYDLANNSISRTVGDPGFGDVSTSGKRMAVAKNTIGDVCNGYGGDAVNAYDIIDPVSGEIVGSIGVADNHVDVVAFSPDDREVLYYSEKLWENSSDCGKNAQKSYFKKDISTNTISSVADPMQILSAWNSGGFLSTQEKDPDSSMWTLKFNNQAILTSDMDIRVIAEYYQ
jgi:hypothetical protein